MVCVKMIIICLKGTEKSSSNINFILRCPTGISIRPTVIHSAHELSLFCIDHVSIQSASPNFLSTD